MDAGTKKWLFWGGGGVALALVGWYLYEQHAAAASAALPPASGSSSSSSSSSIAPSTTSDATDQGSYGEEDYSNPYGMTPEEYAAEYSSVPQGVVMQRPLYFPGAPAASARCPVTHPQSFAQWLAVQTWAHGQPRTTQAAEYQTYLQRWRAGLYGGPAVGCPGHLAGLGWRRRRYGGGGGYGGGYADDASSGGFDPNAGGGYYSDLVYDPDGGS